MTTGVTPSRFPTTLQAVVDAVKDVIFQIDGGGAWQFLSPSWRALTGFAVEDAIGRPVLDVIHPAERSAMTEALRATLADGVTTRRRSRIVTSSGRTKWVRVTLSPLRDEAGDVMGSAGTIDDETSRHVADVLFEVAAALDGKILEGDRGDGVLQGVVEHLGTALDYRLVCIGLKQAAGEVRFAAQAGPGAAALADYRIRWDDAADGAGPIGVAIKTGRTRCVAVADAAADLAWARVAAAAGLAQVVAVPLTSHGEVHGALCVGVADPDNLDGDHVAALEAFAVHLVLALKWVEHHGLLILQAAAMASSASALFITDPAGRIEWVNASFEKMSGYGSDEAVGRTPALLRSDLQDAEIFRNMWAAVREGQVWQGEIVNRRKSGETYAVAQTVTPLLDHHGAMTHLVACHEDITARRKAEMLASHMALHDAVTDLPNRAFFTERIQIAMVQAEHARQTVSLLFVDLDRFKLVNDTLGHLAGDGLLRMVADRLRGCVRDGDLVARFGGDEFVVLLPNADTRSAALVAERILETLSHPVKIADRDICLTASIGIAFNSPDASTYDELVRRADAAMYRAKEVGRNGYATFSADLESRPGRALSIGEGLRRALALGELMLRYQPQIDIATGALAGVEALLRWQSPELGMVSPGDFIPIAEQSGIIIDIDRWVVHTACEQIRTWQLAGVSVPRVSVNVSGVTVRRGRMATMIEEALVRTQADPRRLEIELTEGVLMHDATKVIETLDALRRLGVRVALDDFGTGYSSLGYLKRFKLDVLKIDRSFVTGLPDDQDSCAIAQLIVAMANALRMETVAEGVETAAQLAFLRGVGCRTAQGFLYGAAVSPEEVIKFAADTQSVVTAA